MYKSQCAALSKKLICNHIKREQSYRVAKQASETMQEKVEGGVLNNQICHFNLYGPYTKKANK